MRYINLLLTLTLTYSYKTSFVLISKLSTKLSRCEPAWRTMSSQCEGSAAALLIGLASAAAAARRRKGVGSATTGACG